MTIEPEVYFYDTSSLLLAGEKIFNNKEHFLISSITLQELENIKSSSKKSQEVKYKARNLLRLLNEYTSLYTVIIHSNIYLDQIEALGLEINNDTKILSDAYFADTNKPYLDRIIFVTNDLALKNIANLLFADTQLESIEEERDLYTGYKDIIASENEIEDFYNNSNINYFNLLENEYLILRNQLEDIIDLRVWRDGQYNYLQAKPFNSKLFGRVIPHDNYQKMAFDSLRNNQATMLRGRSGSGKTLLSLAYLFQELEQHNIDKIIMFVNPVAAINSAKLGYTPGDLNSKILDS